MSIKNFVYILACLCYSVIIGAAVYEHVAVWPNAFADLPRSLSSFQGEFGLNNAPFWQAIHPVTLVLFIVALLANWKESRRKYLVIPLIVYMLVLVATFIYFVPELLTLVKTPFSNSSDQSLTSRADLWEILSIVRLFFLIVSAIVLYSGLTKFVETSRKDQAIS